MQNRFLLLSIGFIIVGVLVAFLVSISLARPIRGAIEVMRTLASGNLNVQIPDARGRNEVAEMLRTLLYFRNETAARERLEQEQAHRDADEACRRQQDREILARTFENSVDAVMRDVTESRDTVQTSLGDMAQAIAASRNSADATAMNAVHVASNMQIVASAVEELTASIQDISSQIQHTRGVTETVMTKAEHSIKSINSLENSTNAIDDVVRFIQGIADKTNLLALNATIESARAGEAGRGFAVVAGEVKSLAEQTAKATKEISQKILDIQSSTSVTAKEVRVIFEFIQSIRVATETISSTMIQQTTAIGEISRSVTESARNVNTLDMETRRTASATNTADSSSQSLQSCTEALGTRLSTLESEIGKFLQGIRAA